MTRFKSFFLVTGMLAIVLTVILSSKETALAKKPPRPAPYYTKEECDAKFVTREEADQKFLAREEADATFLTIAEAYASFPTTEAADERFINDGQGEVDGADIAVGTEVVGTNGGGPVFRATNTERTV